ncbi:MAG TPA: hypothetical protein VLL25_13840, partial [Acidimicrobiales bacterium]|nr:hypothetical protein [Acidimicrobiales bacterium]
MTAPPDIRSPRARAVAIAVAGLGLLSLVALASQRPLLRAPTHTERALGSGWTSPLLTVAVVLGAAVLLYGIMLARREGRRTTGSDGWRLIGALVIIVVVSLLFHHYHDSRSGPRAVQTPPTSVGQPRATTASPPTTRRHHGTGATWWEVAGLAAAAALALAAARVHPEKGVSKEREVE